MPLRAIARVNLAAIERNVSHVRSGLAGGAALCAVVNVSMDNITIALGPDPSVRVGDVATIIGRNGPLLQTAEDLANRIGTINYEIVCGISRRVPRVYHRDGEPA